MANEIRTIFYIIVIVSYFVRQGDPFGEQKTNAGHFRPEVVFCLPLRRPGEQITNYFRTILFLSFFGSPNKCLGDHFTNGIRNISTFGTPSFFCSFFGAPWRLHGKWNTNNFLYLRNTVVFCSPGRPIWRTKYECGALSPRSRFLFAIQAPWRLKYEWKNTVAQWSFLVRISSACLRMRISFGATTLRIPPGWYLRTRPEGVTHSPRRSYAFAPNGLRIRPEGVTHSPRMIYAFAPQVLRIRPEGVTHSPRRCYAFVWANKIRPFVLLGKSQNWNFGYF